MAGFPPGTRGPGTPGFAAGRAGYGAAMTTILYKPLSLLATAAGGLVAGVVFSRAWRLLASDDEVPSATDEKRSWREVLAAAALQGAVFGTVKAALDRASAQGVARATGSWPKS